MRVLLLLVSLFLSACAPSVRVIDASDEFALAREFNGRSALIGLADGRAVSAQSLRMDADSSSWTNVDTGGFEVVPTASVVRVKRPETAGEGVGRGIRQGAIAGAVAGGLVYSLVGSALGANESETVALVGVGAASGGLSGAFWGGLVGVLVPGSRSFELAPQGEPNRVPLGRRALPGGRDPMSGEPLGLRASDPLNLRVPR